MIASAHPARRLSPGAAAVALAAVLSAAALAAPTPARAQLFERFTLEGDRVAVINLAGEVRVLPSDGANVEVAVTRHGDAAAELRIERDVRDGWTRLRVVYPGNRVVYPEIRRGTRVELRVGRDGALAGGVFAVAGGRRVTIAGSGRGTRAHADITVRVPRGAHVHLQLAAGQLEVNDVEAETSARVRAVRVTTDNTRGPLRIDGSSGAVTVTRARGDVVVDVGSGRVEATDVQGERIVLDTGSGRVTAADIEGSDVRIDTRSGRVNAERVRAGRLVIDTGSGAVAGGAIEADDLVVDTGSGSVNLSAVAARALRVDTGSGSVRLGLRASPESALIDTGSGSVTVRVPETFAAELDIRSRSRIEVDLPAYVVERTRRRFVARIGEAGGRFRIDTGSGSVRVLPGEPDEVATPVGT